MTYQILAWVFIIYILLSSIESVYDIKLRLLDIKLRKLQIQITNLKIEKRQMLNALLVVAIKKRVRSLQQSINLSKEEE